MSLFFTCKHLSASRRSFIVIDSRVCVCVRNVFFSLHLVASSLLRFDRFPLSQCRQFLFSGYKCSRIFFRSLVENYAERLPVRACWFHSQCDLEKKVEEHTHTQKKLDRLKASSFSAHTSFGMTILLSMVAQYNLFFLPPDYCALQSDQGYFSQFSVNFALMIKTFCVTIVFGSRAMACNEPSVRNRREKI